MKSLPKLMIGALPMLISGCMLLNVAEVVSYEIRTASAKKTPYQEQEAAIYEHMKRYGINRGDVTALRDLSTHPYPYTDIYTDNLLKPGEHYRIEMDEFILTMKVPEAQHSMGQKIWPYISTRTEADRERFAKESNRNRFATLSRNMFDLGWHINPPLFGGADTWGASASYRALNLPQEAEDFSTPEKLRQLSNKIMRDSIIPEERIREAAREGNILNGGGKRVLQDAEIVTINGRRWIRKAMEMEYGHKRSYTYTTTLLPDRMVGISFGMPRYNYNANPDRSNHPEWLRNVFAQMEEMVASLRIAKINDDGSPDPFVIERVEPAPLPVREKLPTSP